MPHREAAPFRRALGAVLLLIALLLAGCGGSDPSGPGGQPADDTPLTADQLTGLSVLFGAGSGASDLSQTALTYLVEAVYAIIDQTGTAALTGTVTELGTLNYSYQPTPTDHLRLVLQNGAVLDYVVTAFQPYASIDPGYYTGGGPYEFVDLHQSVAFTLTGSGLSLQVASSSVPQAGQPVTVTTRFVQRTRTLAGSVQANTGGTLTYDLAETATREFNIITGQSDGYDLDVRVTGTATWQGQALTVNEHMRSIQERDVTSLDGTPQYTVRNLIRESSNSGVLGGETFAFDGARVVSETRNGAVNQPGYWAVEGLLRRDGGVLGALGFTASPQSGGQPPRAAVDLSGTGQGTQVIDGATLGG
ncbi:MAG TPA: hypothetical protein P5571_13310 [Candidatus Krumholzibacteria bacterium]|nr:hypothetical protein [Candidatus Krumholzibacteria bacterium]HRX52341.1 hypothetical protein [Candidatus Krumholzibacteria bacterium]